METKIKINNIQLFGYHGNGEKEKSTGQLFEIDIEVSPVNDTPIQAHTLSLVPRSIDQANVGRCRVCRQYVYGRRLSI